MSEDKYVQMFPDVNNMNNLSTFTDGHRKTKQRRKTLQIWFLFHYSRIDEDKRKNLNIIQVCCQVNSLLWLSSLGAVAILFQVAKDIIEKAQRTLPLKR